MAHVLASKLKATILHAAMSGRLTERNINDTPIYDTLKEIEKDRNNRVLKKEIKKDKRLCDKVISDERFDIPDTWKWTTLGAILYKLTDGTHKTPKYTTDGVKFVSVKDMSSGVLSLENTKFISESEHKELFARCNPQKGDIILSKVGTTGVPAIVDTDEPFSLFVSVALLKFNDALVNRQFLYHLIMSPDIQQQAAENTRGIGNKNWVLDEIANTEIPLPPIEEQARIVARVDELMAKIDEYEKLENELVELKKSFPGDMKAAVLQAAMQGKLTGRNWNEDDNPEMYVPLWSVTAWDKKFKAVDRSKQKKVMDYHYYLAADMKAIQDATGDVYLLSTGDYEGWTTEEKTEGNFRIGEIVSIPWGGNPKVKYYKGKFITSDNRIATALNNEELDNKYLYYFMQSKVDYLDTIYRGTGLRHPDMAAVLDMQIPLPPIEEQRRIVEKLDKILPLCEEFEKEMA